MDRVKVIPFSVMTTAAIAVIAMVTVPVSADSGRLARDCPLNEVKGNPENPHTFFRCLSDGPVLMSCGSAKIFDAAVGKCVAPTEEQQKLLRISDRPKLVNFQHHKNDKGNPSSTLAVVDNPEAISKAAPTCTKPHDEPEYLRYDGDCSKFWQCSNGQPVEFSCPWPTVWNPDINNCDWPQNVRCTWGTSTTTVRSVDIPVIISSELGSPPVVP